MFATRPTNPEPITFEAPDLSGVSPEAAIALLRIIDSTRSLGGLDRSERKHLALLRPRPADRVVPREAPPTIPPHADPVLPVDRDAAPQWMAA
jgi:hypothetical protein